MGVAESIRERVPGGAGLPQAPGRVPQGRDGQGGAPDPAGAGPAARGDRRDPRGQAQDPLPLVPQGRDPPDAALGRGVRRQGRDAPARPRGLQGGRRDREARRRRLRLLRLVGLQVRGVRRDPVRVPAHARARRDGVLQLGFRRARPAAQLRGVQGRQVRQRAPGRRARVRHVEPGEAARHRRPGRIARGRQGRRLRGVERRPALDILDDAGDLDRGQEVLRPRGRSRRPAGARERARLARGEGQGKGRGIEGDDKDKDKAKDAASAKPGVAR